ncbi:hypothetical protein SAMN05428642_1109 [Flaviramulus basaltis]|uniref:DUF4136 domain-containing protein n=1 Tax=Flaviramulus basaltis TaxID=369401 RepID=A0A1K2IS95_9FLAO|nr:hypothetical protein [Flaviramulus basaltis]SFZ95182.1 hypothetical protein SAMN05428642_1109 [Flaviramulus basaltis]
MKKSILFIYVVLLTSCHTTSYVHDYESTPYGIEYEEGKWLLNEINSPESIKSKVTKIAHENFYKHLGDKLKKAEDLKNISLSHVPMKPEKMFLERAKKESGFDYLINIKCSSSKNEIGGLKIGQTYRKRKNVAESILEVYDLNTLEIIYSRKVIGQVSVDENDNEDFSFVKSSSGIMISCLKRIIKKIN